jgi:hypothetical protein
MATLAGQRAQFTWSLNQYNLSEDPDIRAKFASRMAKYIAAAPANGFTPSQVTGGQSYPSEVDQLVNDPSIGDDPGITEEQAVRTVKEIVDTSDVTQIGEGAGVVYVYGYRCCQDRVKIGLPIQLEQAAQPLREAGGHGGRRRAGCLSLADRR